MTVPGPTEILAVVRPGRADAGGVTFFTAQNLAKESGGSVEVTDPSKMPKDTLNWVGIAFRPSDSFRGAAAAGRDRARVGDATQDHAVRRGDVRS
jgi:hypothetical protein